MRHYIFFVSDGTGITAETIGHSLMSQFSKVEFIQERVRFVDSEEKARKAVKRINQVPVAEGKRPIVVSTVVNERLCQIIHQSKALVLDPFAVFLSRMEADLELPRSAKPGRTHGMTDTGAYERRIEATNYALSHDDGITLDFAGADLILVGVSRSGKTPTCLYMALQYGVKAANYPLTEEDLESDQLPAGLRVHRKEIFGLTIDPNRLHQIREERRPGSRYSDLRQCRREVRDAESIFRMERVPYINTTHTSIEEIASKVMESLSMQLELF